MMLLGWGTLAVPTGIVTAEMTLRRHGASIVLGRACAACGAAGYGPLANFCQQCGGKLPPPVTTQGQGA
jgi:voltage-gated potassium channel